MALIASMLNATTKPQLMPVFVQVMDSVHQSTSASVSLATLEASVSIQFVTLKILAILQFVQAKELALLQTPAIVQYLGMVGTTVS